VEPAKVLLKLDLCCENSTNVCYGIDEMRNNYELHKASAGTEAPLASTGTALATATDLACHDGNRTAFFLALAAGFNTVTYT